ncbi:MAG: hypothetical protein UHI81_10135 [Olegusella sp.]|nr:hypothetical protein [Olegusella sp.]
MAANYVSVTDLDDYLSTPDCPDCGSEDVDLVTTMRDGDWVIKQYRCNVCGHVWTERTHATA